MAKQKLKISLNIVLCLLLNLSFSSCFPELNRNPLELLSFIRLFSPPTAISSFRYANTPFTFTNGAAIPTITPVYEGMISSCTVSPTLPSGISLDSTTCVITGTPTTNQSATEYQILARNSRGNAPATITINLAPPSALTYTGSPYTFTQNATIATITPTFTGTVTGCVPVPTLPTGLGINNITCAISGTPTATQGATAYTITASNAFGITQAAITITINLAPPSALTYTGSPYTFTQNATIATITPTFTGTVTGCVSAPTLPPGLGINSTTCALTGIPTAIQAATAYSITASNAFGSTTASIFITVNNAAPSALTYTGSPYTFTQSATIATITPTFTGTLTGCVSVPPLPTGLGINNLTCEISGMPTATQGATAYTITASNGGGSATASIFITINNAAPSALMYTGSPYTFTLSATIATITPSVSGTVTGCSSFPTLPPGLGINNLTCAITGTPTAIQAATTYTITASNGGGNTTAVIDITIDNAPPSALTYSGSPYTFTLSATIATITPSVSGTVTGCSSFPTLPTGLGINNLTCAITGTPTVLQGATAYTITALNGSGNTTAGITITVNNAAPSALSYTGSPYTFTQNAAIATIMPTVTGTVTGCVSAPTLPTGLGINNITCAISGMPTATQGATLYTITASNGGGSTMAVINITINNTPPSGLTYTGSPFTFTRTLAIATITPTVTGTVTGCVSAPPLPPGLSINSVTCAISGTPSGIVMGNNYTITPSNAFGNGATVVINITVNNAGPSALTYTGSPYTFNQNVMIARITPTVTGTVTGCVSAPPLPAGLVINNTCRISGTPTVLQAATAYTITASNINGITTASININVVP